MAPDGGALGGGNDAQAVLVVAAEDGSLVEARDGTQVPLVRAPQGGHIMLVGAKLQNSTDCMLDATGDLRDPTTGRVIGLDQRSLLLSSGSDGWAQPSDPALSSMPNVAVCPSAAASKSIDGNPYTVELALVDGDGKSVAMLSATVTPMCPAGDDYCHTECSPGG
jgi:hypothetical protein